MWLVLKLVHFACMGLGNRKITCFFASLKLIHHIEMHLIDAPSVLKIEILETRKKNDLILLSYQGQEYLRTEKRLLLER